MFQPTDDILIPLPAVKTITGLSSSSIYALVAKKAFPRPAKIGAASRWSQREINAWVKQRLQQREVAA